MFLEYKKNGKTYKQVALWKQNKVIHYEVKA